MPAWTGPRRTAELSPFPALAAAAARGGKPDAAWQALEQNLARGLLDDLAARPLSAEDRGREQELLGRLDLLDRQVAALPAGGDGRGRKTADELRRQRDAAQAEFVRFQADLAATYGVAAGEVYDLARIQAQLREDAALLAWVDLSDQAKRVDPKGDHWACLVRHRAPRSGCGCPAPARTARGPTRTTGSPPGPAAPSPAARPTRAGQWKDLARQLARQRLAPLEEHLKAEAGLPAVRHLIVLPSHQDGGAVPVEALTDRFTVSYAPSGTMFAWLQEHRPRPGARRRAVCWPSAIRRFSRRGTTAGCQGGRPAAEAGGRRSRRCRGRARNSGRRPGLLQAQAAHGAEASEQNLDQLAASGGLREFRYLHFATHGVLDDQRPMRSALILAQDRLPTPVGGTERRSGLARAG